MTYTVAWYAAWGVAVVGVIAGVLAGVGHTGLRPGWLTDDISATAAIVSAICVGMAALLPAVGRTPAAREHELLSARQYGTLPKDLAEKHAALVEANEPP